MIDSLKPAKIGILGIYKLRCGHIYIIVAMKQYHLTQRYKAETSFSTLKFPCHFTAYTKHSHINAHGHITHKHMQMRANLFGQRALLRLRTLEKGSGCHHWFAGQRTGSRACDATSS